MAAASTVLRIAGSAALGLAVAFAPPVVADPAGAAPPPATADAHADRLACRSRPVLPEGRPRIGLALGGGGARGIAHVGVLQALEAANIPIDCIAGTSMGALVGGLYASGIGVDELEATVLGLDWPRMFDDALERRERSYRRKVDDRLVLSSPGVGIGGGRLKLAGGLVSGERIVLLFSRLLAPVALVRDFDQLPIPFSAVAADINTGEPHIMRDGDLALAMRASMSLPGVFPPVQIGDRVLVDGGVARNLPIDVVRAMGADIVIAVDVGTPLGEVTAASSALAIASQVTGLLTTANTRAQLATLGPRDVLISPPLGREVGTAEFAKAPQALAMGRQGAAAAADRLALLSIAPEAHAYGLERRSMRSPGPPVIAFVRLANASRYSDEALLSRLDLVVGEPLDTARLDASLYRVYGIETFAQVRYELVEEGGEVGLLVHAEEKVQGPNYVEAGLSLNGTLGGDPGFGIRLGLLQSPVNDIGGELRHLVRLGDESGLMSEYYQPFGRGGRGFFTGRIEYESLRLPKFDAHGDRIAEFDIRQGGLAAGVGREFGNVAAVGIGLRRYRGDVRVAIGDPDLEAGDFDVGEAFVTLAVDRLDSAFFPRQGYLARAAYSHSHSVLGADADFGQFELDALVARARGPLAVQAGLRYYTTTSGDAPLHSLYRLGGFSRLVGFQPNEVSGQHAVVLLSGASYRIAKVLNQEALAGVLLEYGNAWQLRDDIGFDDAVMNASAYIGLDSWVGPIIFGVGVREQGEYNVFLELGHAF